MRPLVDPDLIPGGGVSRRWFIGALGLIVAKPTVLLPRPYIGIIPVPEPAFVTHPSGIEIPLRLFDLPYHQSDGVWLGINRGPT